MTRINNQGINIIPQGIRKDIKKTDIEKIPQDTKIVEVQKKPEVKDEIKKVSPTEDIDNAFADTPNVNLDKANEAINTGIVSDAYEKEVKFSMDIPNKSPEEAIKNLSKIYDFSNNSTENKVISQEMNYLIKGSGVGKTLKDLNISNEDIALFVNNPMAEPPASIKALQQKLDSEGSWTAQATLTRLTKIRVEFSKNELKNIDERLIVLKVKASLSPEEQKELKFLLKNKSSLENSIKKDSDTLSFISDKASKVKMSKSIVAINALKSKMDSISDKSSKEYIALKSSLDKVYTSSEKEVKQINDYAIKTSNGKPNTVASDINASMVRIGLTYAEVESSNKINKKERNILLTNQKPDDNKSIKGGVGYYVEKAIEFGKKDDVSLKELRISYTEARNKDAKEILDNDGIKISNNGFELQDKKPLTDSQAKLMGEFITDTKDINKDLTEVITNLDKKIEDKINKKAPAIEISQMYEKSESLFAKKRDSEIVLGGIYKQNDQFRGKIEKVLKYKQGLEEEAKQLHDNETLEGSPTEHGKYEKDYQAVLKDIRETKEELEKLKRNPVQTRKVDGALETIDNRGAISELEAKLSEKEKVKGFIITVLNSHDKRYEQLKDETGNNPESIKGADNELKKVVSDRNNLRKISVLANAEPNEVKQYSNAFRNTVKWETEMFKKVPDYVKNTTHFKQVSASTNLKLASDSNRATDLIAYSYAKDKKQEVMTDKDAIARAKENAKKTIEEQYKLQGRSVPETPEIKEQLEKLEDQNLKSEAENVFNDSFRERKTEVASSAFMSFKKASDVRKEINPSLPKNEAEKMAIEEVITGNSLALGISDKNPNDTRSILESNIKTINNDITEDKLKRTLKIETAETTIDSAFRSRKVIPPQLNGASSALIRIAGELHDEIKSFKEFKGDKKETFEKNYQSLTKIHEEEISSMKNYLTDLKIESENVNAFLKFKMEKFDDKVFDHFVAAGWMYIRSELVSKGEISVDAFISKLDEFKASLDVKYKYEDRIKNLENFIKDYEQAPNKEVFIERSRYDLFNADAKEKGITDRNLSEFISNGLDKEPSFKKIADDNLLKTGSTQNLQGNILHNLDVKSNNLDSFKMTDILGIDTNEFKTGSEVLDKTLAMLNRTETTQMLAEIVVTEVATAGLASGIEAMRVGNFLRNLVTKYPEMEKAIALAKTLYNLAPNVAKEASALKLKGILGEFKNIVSAVTNAEKAAQLAGLRNIGKIAVEAEKISKIQTFVKTSVHMTQVILTQELMTKAAKSHFGEDSVFAKAVEKCGQFLFISSADKFAGVKSLASRVGMNWGITLGQQFSGIIVEQVYKDLIYGPNHVMSSEERKEVQKMVAHVSMAVGVLIPSIMSVKHAHSEEVHQKTNEQLSVLMKDVNNLKGFESNIYNIEKSLGEYNLSKTDPKYTNVDSMAKLKDFKQNIDSLLSEKNLPENIKETLQKNTEKLLQQETIDIALREMPSIDSKNPIEYGEAVKKHLESFNAKEKGLSELSKENIEKTVLEKTIEKSLKGVEVLIPDNLKNPKELQEILKTQKKELNSKLQEILKTKEEYKDPVEREKAIKEMVEISQKISLEQLLSKSNITNPKELANILKSYEEGTGNKEGLDIDLKIGDKQLTTRIKLTQENEFEFKVNGSDKSEKIKLDSVLLKRVGEAFEFSSAKINAEKGNEEVKNDSKLPDIKSPKEVNEFLKANIDNPKKIIELYNTVGWDNIKGLEGKIDKNLFEVIHTARDNFLKETWDTVYNQAKADGVELEFPYVGTPPTNPEYKKVYSDLDFSIKIKTENGKEPSTAKRLELEIKYMRLFRAEIDKTSKYAGFAMDSNVYPTLKPVAIAKNPKDISPEILKKDQNLQLDMDFYQIRFGCGDTKSGIKAWNEIKEAVLEKAKRTASKNSDSSIINEVAKRFEIAESKFNNHKKEIEDFSETIKKENPNIPTKAIEELALNKIREKRENDLLEFLKKDGELLDKDSIEGQKARAELSKLQIEAREVLPEAYFSHAAAEWGSAGDKDAMKSALTNMSDSNKLRGRISQLQYVFHWTAEVSGSKDLATQIWKLGKYDLRNMDFLGARLGGIDMKDSSNMLDTAISEVKSKAKTKEEALNIWIEKFGSPEKAEQVMKEYLSVIQMTSIDFLSNYYTHESEPFINKK
ncbi:MAG: hypothetical protein U0457_10200 [Candidatus Sericytochromatia bacterium]